MYKTKIIQTTQNIFNVEYQFEKDEEIIGTASINKNVLGGIIECRYKSSKYKLCFDQKAGVRFYYIFDEKEQKLGWMERGYSKGGFLRPGFFYTKVNFYDRGYNIYDIGLGKKGIYYPCYESKGEGDGLQIGIMHKNVLVENLKDTYECLVKNDDDDVMMILFALYNDFWNFRHTAQKAVNSKQMQYFYTVNKRLKAKFNPDFLKDD